MKCALQTMQIILCALLTMQNILCALLTMQNIHCTLLTILNRQCNHAKYTVHPSYHAKYTLRPSYHIKYTVQPCKIYIVGIPKFCFAQPCWFNKNDIVLENIYNPLALLFVFCKCCQLSNNTAIMFCWFVFRS